MKGTVAQALRDNGGVLSRRDHPRLAETLSYLCRRGELVSVLPGVYIPADVSGDWRVLARAACVWNRDAVLATDVAAALSFWPELRPGVIEVANARARFQRKPFAISARVIPQPLVYDTGEVRLTRPALTALELVEAHGSDGIDRALRSRMTTLSPAALIRSQRTAASSACRYFRRIGQLSGATRSSLITSARPNMVT